MCWLMLALLAGYSKTNTPLAASGMPIARPLHDLREIPGTVADLTVRGDTVRIDETPTRILKSVGIDGDIFVFEGSEPRIAVQTGDIVHRGLAG